VKKSATVTLTLVAAMGVAARTVPRPDPCAPGAFNELACQAAVQNQGYCWGGRWVRLEYHYPFPYYYDLYREFLAAGGIAVPAATGACAQPAVRAGRTFLGSHAARAGFGSTGSCHSPHS